MLINQEISRRALPWNEMNSLYPGFLEFTGLRDNQYHYIKSRHYKIKGKHGFK